VLVWGDMGGMEKLDRFIGANYTNLIALMLKTSYVVIVIVIA